MEPLTLVQNGMAFRLQAPEGTYSYYHPKKLFTGLGWDAQTASLLLARSSLNSILILGLGGGTVARQCRALFPHAHIAGVEMNPAVLDLAYRNFGIGSLGLEVILERGESYIKATNKVFDAIIDDMWMPNATHLKPVLVEPNWPGLIRTRLAPHGVYAVNLYSRSESKFEVPMVVKRLAPEFAVLREVQPFRGQTTVIVAGASVSSPCAARERLRSLPARFADELRQITFRSL